MLAALASSQVKKYIGTDPAGLTFEGLSEMEMELPPRQNLWGANRQKLNCTILAQKTSCQTWVRSSLPSPARRTFQPENIRRSRRRASSSSGRRNLRWQDWNAPSPQLWSNRQSWKAMSPLRLNENRPANSVAQVRCEAKPENCTGWD